MFGSGFTGSKDWQDLGGMRGERVGVRMYGGKLEKGRNEKGDRWVFCHGLLQVG
jgi:hypothetical protein